MTAPTPAEFAREVATRFSPPSDPANPFFKPVDVAVHRLLIQAVAEVLGPRDPFAQFSRAYEHAYCLSFPAHYSEEKTAELETCLDDMRAAWEVIELDVCQTIESMRG